MRTIENLADIEEGLDFLVRRDRRLRKVVAEAGPVPLRRQPAGFEGLARIIVGQQVSIASAEAIWKRFIVAFPGCPVAVIETVGEDALRAPGLSSPKIRALRAAAVACREGLDLDGLTTLPAEEAHARLTAVKGIGPWTADIYLLFCLGHADIFPAGDIALRKAVADAFEIGTPSIDETARIAVEWSPWRGVAARLLWAYYKAKRQSISTPVWIV